jgi:Ca2+/Na+ antiporter
MKILETALTGIVLFALLATSIVIPVDINSFYNDEETYAKVYHLGSNKEIWESAYLSRFIFPIIVVIVGLTIITLRLVKNENRLIKKVNWMFLVFFCASVIINFYCHPTNFQ